MAVQALNMCSFKTHQRNQICSALRCGQCEGADPSAGKASMWEARSLLSVAQHGQPKEQQKGARPGWLGLCVHQLLGQAAFARSTGEAGPSVDGPGAKPRLDTFPSRSLTIRQGKCTQRLNIKSIVWLIFRKVFLARAGGTFPLVFPDFCGDLRYRQLLVPAAPEAGPACHFPQQPTSGLLARLMNIIEDRIKGRSFPWLQKSCLPWFYCLLTLSFYCTGLYWCTIHIQSLISTCFSFKTVTWTIQGIFASDDSLSKVNSFWDQFWGLEPSIHFVSACSSLLRAAVLPTSGLFGLLPPHLLCRWDRQMADICRQSAWGTGRGGW